jgi:hypothetical protein
MIVNTHFRSRIWRFPVYSKRVSTPLDFTDFPGSSEIAG